MYDRSSFRDEREDRPLSNYQSRKSIDAPTVEPVRCAKRDSPLLARIVEDDEAFSLSEQNHDGESPREMSTVYFVLMASNRNRRAREAERARRELQINMSGDSAFYEPTESEHGRLSDGNSSPEIYVENYDMHP